MLQITELQEESFRPFVDLAMQMQQECEPDIPFEEYELLINMFRCVEDPSRLQLNAWLCWSNKKLIGMAVAAASSFYFSRTTAAVMHYWYVLPEYRGTRAAIVLLRAFEQWARRINAARMYAGAERINDVELADKINSMIEKRGFVRFGHQYYKVISDGK